MHYNFFIFFVSLSAFRTLDFCFKKEPRCTVVKATTKLKINTKNDDIEIRLKGDNCDNHPICNNELNED